ncbi:MAG: hypothetical protein ACXWE6_12440, partial [Nitrososphaeraceae archaeon]
MENKQQLDLDLFIEEQRIQAKLEKYILKLTPEQYDALEKASKEYKDRIDSNIEKLSNDPRKILNYLFRNKETCIMKRRDAEKRDDLLNEKNYQLLIDEVLDPKIRMWWVQLQTTYEIAPKGSNSQQTDIGIKNSNSTIPETQLIRNTPPFQQIKCDASEQDTLDFFMPLCKILNYVNRKPIMEEKDIIDFVHNNFAIFGKPYTQKYYALNIPSKSSFTFLIYQFYHRYDYNDIKNKMKYAELLICNFKDFAKDNCKTLCSNMGFSKRPKNGHNMIDIDEFL